jgi:SAM-dependent methyltransferase
VDRRAQILKHVPLDAGVGLEIGPLHRPIVGRNDADVLYVDHATTEDLVAKYAYDPEVDEVLPVDVIWGDRRLREALGERRAHWVIASHVIEHVPDPVGWLTQIGEVLVPGGVLSLAVPDKRFCFDAKRRVTDVSVFVDAALTGRTRPSLGATYDFWTRVTAVDPGAVWAGTAAPDQVPDNPQLGLEKCRELLRTDEYRDIHASVFTPQSFVDVLADLGELDLLPPFEVIDVEPTPHWMHEFYASLRWLGGGGELTPAQQRDRQVRSLHAAQAKVAGASRPAVPVEGKEGMALSPAEMRLVELKRDALFAARRGLGGARTAARSAARSARRRRGATPQK